jgi:hypothetical protein
MMRLASSKPVVLVAVVAAFGALFVRVVPAAAVNAPAPVRAGHARYDVYWDQNEQEDFLSVPATLRGQLIPPWDPNGQLCVLGDGSGRFVVGYNPTLASQNNPGSLKPVKLPPIGEALYDRHGRFTGQTLSVPGSFAGGDIPPDVAGAGGGAFNNNGTMTGCAIDARGDVFASDLGTAQGAFPPPDDGRIIEWFAPSYRSFCVVDGPTADGVGPHHVDGTGGLRQPGDLAIDPNTADLLVPEAGSPTGGIGGRMLRFAASSLPRSAADCAAAGLYPRTKLRVSTFVQGNASRLPFPVAIARDPTCECWAISTVIGNPSVVWVHDDGSLVAGRSLPGEDIAHLGEDPNAASPFGIAFAPDGTLYETDIHIRCSAPLVGCGPASLGGRELRISFTHDIPNTPTVLASGLDFPTSVTVCVAGRAVCPQPPALGRG